MAGYQGDIHVGDTIDVKFTTTSASTGAPTQLAGSPVISAYIGNSTTQLTAGITLSVDFDGVTGLNNVRVVAAGASGYAAATNVSLVITAGTVGGTSAVGYEVGSFSIDNRGMNQILGTAVSAPATAGVLDINVKNINNVAAATPGAAGGALIAGSNAGTTTFGALTVTGATTHTGNVVMSAGLNITQSSSNTSALVVTGNGTGHGGIFTSGSGATGDGLKAASAATNGNGLNLLGNGTGDGLLSTGGASAGGDGIAAVAGGGTDIRAVAITGTLTTVTTATTTTNLTNAPTVGDLTAAMKASVTTAATAATPTAAAVTGAVGSVVGNVGGSTASIGPNGLDAAALATDAVTEIVAAVFARAFSAAYASLTFDQMIKVMIAILAGKVNGLDTGSIAFRNLADSADVVLMTGSTDGNRTSPTITP